MTMQEIDAEGIGSKEEEPRQIKQIRIGYGKKGARQWGRVRAIKKQETQ